MTLTFDNTQITKSIMYKCFTRLEMYNELASFKEMKVLTFCPKTCLITSVILQNAYKLEYTITFNGVPIIPRTVIQNGTNIWFNNILPYNVSTIDNYDLKVIFYSPIPQIIEVETTIISFNPSYFYTLLSSNGTFIDSFLDITCNLNNGSLTLTPNTALTNEQIINTMNNMYFTSNEILQQLPFSGIGLFDFRYFKTIFVTEQVPYYVGTLVIEPKVDILKSIYIQTNDYDVITAHLAYNYQELPNVIVETTKISAKLTFENNLLLNFNSHNEFQLRILTANTIPLSKFLCNVEDLVIYAEGGYVNATTKANNWGNLFITL